MRFLAGHNTRLIAPVGYVQRGTGTQRQFVHRARAVAALGKPLPKGAVVHHVDEDIWSPTARLVICQSQAYHKLLHGRARILKAGGNPNTEKICGHCQIVLPLSAFNRCRRWPDGLQHNCRACEKQLKVSAA